MKFKCIICNELFEGKKEPDICPVCGATKEKFIKIYDNDQMFRKDTEEYFLIIGNGAAGYYAADAIRKRNKTCKITLLSNESELTYYRPILSDLINKDVSESFYISQKTWYEENNIYTLLDTNVEKIDEENQMVILENGYNLKYDKLIIATGSSNFIPQVKGYDLENVFTLRNYSDLKRLKLGLGKLKKVTIIGGGLLGLEAAWEFRERGLDVVVVDINQNILSRQLDKGGSLILENNIKSTGVEIKLNSYLDYIEGKEKVEKIVFKDGTSIDCDMVVFSVGVRANTKVVKDTSIKVDRGILVNKYMETSVKNIYACGDVAQLDNMNLAIWPVAVEMGKCSGANATGDFNLFEGDVYPVSLDAFNVNVVSVGNINDFDIDKLENNSNNKYKKLFIKNGILTGAILINLPEDVANIINNIGKEYK